MPPGTDVHRSALTGLTTDPLRVAGDGAGGFYSANEAGQGLVRVDFSGERAVAIPHVRCGDDPSCWHQLVWDEAEGALLLLTGGVAADTGGHGLASAPLSLTTFDEQRIRHEETVPLPDHGRELWEARGLLARSADTTWIALHGLYLRQRQGRWTTFLADELAERMRRAERVAWQKIGQAATAGAVLAGGTVVTSAAYDRRFVRVGAGTLAGSAAATAPALVAQEFSPFTHDWRDAPIAVPITMSAVVLQGLLSGGATWLVGEWAEGKSRSPAAGFGGAVAGGLVGAGAGLTIDALVYRHQRMDSWQTLRWTMAVAATALGASLGYHALNGGRAPTH
jgi:hypothetical protein